MLNDFEARGGWPAVPTPFGKAPVPTALGRAETVDFHRASQKQGARMKS